MLYLKKCSAVINRGMRVNGFRILLTQIFINQKFNKVCIYKLYSLNDHKDFGKNCHINNQNKLELQKEENVDHHNRKLSPRGVPSISCSENIQQIYRRIPMPKCDFNKKKKSYPVNLLHIFKTPFPKNTGGRVLLHNVLFGSLN